MNNLRNEPGWMGAFIRDRAENGLPNGTRVIKTNSKPDDGHPDGTPGVVLGSFSHPEIMDNMVFYFIEWAPRPRVAVGCMASKIEAVFG